MVRAHEGNEMLPAKTPRLLLVVAIALFACLALAGCSAEKQTAAKLHGVWYEDQTGQEYDFISDTQLVLPSPLSNGSNAVSYQIVDGDKISMSQSDVVHVIDITKLDDNELDTHDPAAASDQKYFRSLDDTTWAKNRASIVGNALAALKNFPNITPQSDIVWASSKPTDKADVWVNWPTSSIARYARAWSWSDITRNTAVSLVSSGTTGSEGYAVDFNRTVPTAQQLSAYQSQTGQTVLAGSPHIAVGYSSQMTSYSAGTFVYLNSELLYSLGGGFMINVHVGPTEADGFSPSTHS
jgi:hypothetical protein